MPSLGLPALPRGRLPGRSPRAPAGPAGCTPPGRAAARRPPGHRPRPPGQPRTEDMPAARIGERAPARPLSRPPGHPARGDDGLGVLPSASTSAHPLHLRSGAASGALPWLLPPELSSRAGNRAWALPLQLLPPPADALGLSASVPLELSSLCPFGLPSYFDPVFTLWFPLFPLLTLFLASFSFSALPLVHTPRLLAAPSLDPAGDLRQTFCISSPGPSAPTP